MTNLRLPQALAGLAALLLAAAALIQLVPYGRDHQNPAVLAEPPWDSPQTRATFMTACGDCHSHETRWPWYTQIAPVSWLIQHDVEEGRSKLNVSVWGLMRENEAEEAAETVTKGEMPLPIYLVMHPEAQLGPEAKAAFVHGLRATFGDEADD